MEFGNVSFLREKAEHLEKTALFWKRKATNMVKVGSRVRRFANRYIFNENNTKYIFFLPTKESIVKYILVLLVIINITVANSKATHL